MRQETPYPTHSSIFHSLNPSESPTCYAQAGVDDAICHDVDSVYGAISQLMGGSEDIKVVFALASFLADSGGSGPVQSPLFFRCGTGATRGRTWAYHIESSVHISVHIMWTEI